MIATLSQLTSLPETTLWLISIWAMLIAVFALPIFKILTRAGLNQMWMLAVIVPFIGVLVLLGVLAFSTWPNEPEGYR